MGLYFYYVIQLSVHQINCLSIDFKFEHLPITLFNLSGQCKFVFFRACWQNYVDYFRCIKKKGEDYEPCNWFKKQYQALCPGFWVSSKLM